VYYFSLLYFNTINYSNIHGRSR